MPRNTVEPKGFCKQGAPCHLPTGLNTIQIFVLNTFCKKSILAQYEADQASVNNIDSFKLIQKKQRRKKEYILIVYCTLFGKYFNMTAKNCQMQIDIR